jgi:hypothetical protein
MLSRLFAAALLVGVSFGAVPAHAVTGVVWQWPEGVTRRFVARSDVQLGEAVEFNAANNIDAYASRIKLALILSCRATSTVGKQAWNIRCDIDDASVEAQPTPATQARAGEVAEEWALVYRDLAWIEFVMGADGSIRSFDLEGVDKRIRRLQAIGEVMRQIAMRALAPLNLQLPKKGDDRGQGGWVQNDSLALMLPSNQGTLGNAPITHTLNASPAGSDQVLSWVSQGSGVLASSEEMNESARNTFAMKLDGSARFDRSLGTLLEAQYYAEGRATASSIQAEAHLEAGYTQTAYIQLIPEGEAAPGLPTSRALPVD